MHEAIGNAAADALGELLRPFIRATIRLARYAFSSRYRLEIDEKYRARSRWGKWWYLSRGTVPLLFVVVGISALLLWPRSEPAAKPEHHPLQAVERSITNRIHKDHPQD